MPWFAHMIAAVVQLILFDFLSFFFIFFESHTKVKLI